MNVNSETPQVPRSKAGLFLALLLLGGCGHTQRTTLLDSPAIKVVKVDRERYGIYDSGISRTETRLDIFLDGKLLVEDDYSRMIYGRAADKDYVYPRYVPTQVVGLDDQSMLLRTRYSTPTVTDYRIVRIVVDDHRPRVEPIVDGIAAELGIHEAAMQGWVWINDSSGKLLLIQKDPFAIHTLPGSVLIQAADGIAIVFADAADTYAVRAVDIKTGAIIAENKWDANRYQRPYVEAGEWPKWFSQNFEFKTTPVPVINLRQDNTLTPRPASDGL